MSSYSKRGLVCSVCNGTEFAEYISGSLICTHCGTVSKETHALQVELNMDAIHRDRFGITVKRTYKKKSVGKRKEKKTPLLSLQHVLYIVQNVLQSQVNSVRTYIPCKDEFCDKCREIWLDLLSNSKPFISTFTNVYPYTKKKEAPEVKLKESLDLEEEGHEEPASDSEDDPDPSLPLQVLPFMKKDPVLSQSQSSQSSLMFGGMELPSSLRSLFSQDSALIKMSQGHFSTSPSPTRSRRVSFQADRPLMPKEKTIKMTSEKWNDEQPVRYGKERLYSESGYPLRMPSLIGILYAALRILGCDVTARDLELDIRDGIIPYTNIVSQMTHHDQVYIKPIIQWFSYVSIPSVYEIESEAYLICEQIHFSYPALPVFSLLNRFQYLYHLPPTIATIMKELLNHGHSSTKDISPFLDHSPEENHSCLSLFEVCSNSIIYFVSLLVISIWMIDDKLYYRALSNPQSNHIANTLGLSNWCHIPLHSNDVITVPREDYESILLEYVSLLSKSHVATPVPPLEVSSTVSLQPTRIISTYPIQQNYNYEKLDEDKRIAIQFFSNVMGICPKVLLSHIRSVENMMRSIDKRKTLTRKQKLYRKLFQSS